MNGIFINPRRLSPRQKVIFYYLAMVRRAREAGLPRQDDQTPYEYARSLTSSLEDGKQDVWRNDRVIHRSALQPPRYSGQGRHSG